jgi:YVTN family beta-propeller protein
MRTRIKLVLGTLVASTALVAGLAASAAIAAAPAKPATQGATATRATTACRHPCRTAYVTTMGKNALVPVNTVTGATLKPIPVGHDPAAVVVSPNGATAYVASSPLYRTVTAVSTRAGTAVKTIQVPGPNGMVTSIGITPNGKMLYVSFGSTVVPIRTADYKVFKAIPTRMAVTGFVFTPDSSKLYVNSWDGKVLPISTVSNTAGTPIHLASFADGIASGLVITPNGKTLYAASGSTLTPINTATDKAGPPIRFSEPVIGITISPDGLTGYVSNLGTYAGRGKLFPVELATGKILPPIGLPGVAGWAVFAPDGKRLYMGEQLANTVTAIRTATSSVLSNIKVRNEITGLAITPDGSTVYVLNGATSLTPIRTATNKAGTAIALPGSPTGIAFIRR